MHMITNALDTMSPPPPPPPPPTHTLTNEPMKKTYESQPERKNEVKENKKGII